MIIDTFGALLKFPELGELMKKIEPFYNSLTKDTPNGRYEIDGDRIFAIVSRYETKPFAEGKMETHRKYADMQILVQGKEYIHVQDAAGLNPIGNFSVENDIGFHFTGEQGYSTALIQPGTVAILYPHEAHMPQIKVGERPSSVIKVVIKIAV